MLDKLIVVQAFRTFASYGTLGIRYGIYTRQSPNVEPIRNNSVHTHTLQPSVLYLCLSELFVLQLL